MTPRFSVLMTVVLREEWQVVMTVCALRTLRCTTALPFELILVETESERFSSEDAQHQFSIDEYIRVPQISSQTSDLNKGLAIATGTHVVYTQNDIFTRPGWLEALQEPFLKFDDCGVSTLAASDLQQQPRPVIAEGIYQPLMCFSSEWLFDEDYIGPWGDSDLIMRIYRAGLRSYRNWEVAIVHLLQQTSPVLFSQEQRERQFQQGRELFVHKHQKKAGHLLTYRILTEGLVI